MSTERHSLPGVIGQDLLRHGKLPLILFFRRYYLRDLCGNDST